MPLARLQLHHDTVKHRYSGVVKESAGEWNGALMFSVMRAGLRSCMPLARLQLHHVTVKHRYSSVVKELAGELNGALLFSVMRVGSVCMGVMGVHEYGIDLVSVIFQSAVAHDTQAPPQASWCWGHQL